jgi:hypothetical protein
MNAILKSIYRFLVTMFKETLKAFLLPLTYAISAWISVWVLNITADCFEFIVRWVKDPAAAIWKRVLAGAVGVVTFPALFPSWAARKVWDAVKQHTGFGLDNCCPFPNAKL